MAQAQFPLLRSSFSIGRLTVPNRIVMPAMGVNLGALGGGVSDDLIAYYEARARGGVGLIISEVTRVVDGAGAGEPCQLAARNHSDIPDLQRLVDTIHKYPTKFFIQLQHPGAMSSPAVTGTLPVIPSLPSPEMKDFLHVLTIEECEALVAAFIQGATIAQAAGADGVELHGAHGYLINQFLSPTYNKRDDKYGGSFKGRMRFLTEIIEGIRASCGPNFALSVRINAEEEFPGGSKLKDAQKIAAALEKLGIDLINVTCMGAGTIEPGTYEQGWKRYMASAIKEVVSIPVLAVSNIKRPEIAEQLLADGVCDLVGVARGHLADPQWSAKALEGRADEIRPCIGCLACFDEICKLHRVKCAINPVTGREREFEFIVEDGFGRPVAIVGGGPAGIEAALALEERGFAPVIFEKGDRLGGALNIADKGIGKSFITAYIDFLIEEVERSGIEVRLDTEATIKNVKALKPAGVFVAAGAAPLIPPVKGVDAKNVCTAEDVLLGTAKPEGDVVIIGAGMTGLETAEVLADRGVELTIVEMQESCGCGIFGTVVEDVMGRITDHDAQILVGHRLEKITPDAVKLTRMADNEALEIPADWVVLALGVRPRTDIVEEFTKAFDNVRVIGDANRGGRILEATKDGFGAAFVFGADEMSG